MKQLLVNTVLSPGKTVIMKGDDYHYLCHVRRIKTRETIELKDSTGNRYSCCIKEIHEKDCLIDVGEQILTTCRPYAIHLYLCLCKGNKTDLMIRQATEAGADSITLLDSDYSQVKVREENRQDHKYERWRKIIKEAQQQSGSSINTSLNPLTSFMNLPEIQDPQNAGFFLSSGKNGSQQAHRSPKQMQQHSSCHRIRGRTIFGRN